MYEMSFRLSKVSLLYFNISYLCKENNILLVHNNFQKFKILYKNDLILSVSLVRYASILSIFSQDV